MSDLHLMLQNFSDHYIEKQSLVSQMMKKINKKIDIALDE